MQFIRWQEQRHSMSFPASFLERGAIMPTVIASGNRVAKAVACDQIPYRRPLA
jgi:hypothetical protein